MYHNKENLEIVTLISGRKYHLICSVGFFVPIFTNSKGFIQLLRVGMG